MKEKWRALFERYKAIVDNSKKTDGGRESFKFIEIMDEFLGCSDKVRPKFVKQTQLLENKKKGESKNLDKEEAPNDLEVVENRRHICVTFVLPWEIASRVTAGTTGNYNPSVMYHRKIYHGISLYYGVCNRTYN